MRYGDSVKVPLRQWGGSPLEPSTNGSPWQATGECAVRQFFCLGLLEDPEEWECPDEEELGFVPEA